MPERPDHRPPAITDKLISRLCKEELVEEILGNLYEYHFCIQEEESLKFRKIRFAYQLLTYLRPGMLKRIHLPTIYIPMFRFNLVITLRQLWKNRLHSILNIAGFALGLMCAFLLFFYIQGEQTYDSFHADKDQIYRVLREAEMNGEAYDVGVTSGPFAPNLQIDFEGQIEEVMRVAPRTRLITVGDKSFDESHVVYADSNFFSFFSFPLLQGNPQNVLAKPNSIVLSEEMAQKYFGTEDPIGKILTVNSQHPFEVTGIMGETAARSHINMDFVASIMFYRQSQWIGEWWWNNLMTYVKIPQQEDVDRIAEALPAFWNKHFGEDNGGGRQMSLKLEPLSEVYFNHETRYDMASHGHKKSVNMLGIAALAILLIACFNYINLTIATSQGRAREVGIRKVMGSHSNRISLQFLGEALTVILLGIGLAVAGTTFVLPAFNSFFGLEVEAKWVDPQMLIFFGLLMLAVLLSSAIFPASILARFQPVSALKGKVFTFGKFIWLRKSLVIAQFGISIFLIIGTLLIQRQLDFVENKELGFDGEAVMLLPTNNAEISENLEVFEEKLKKSPLIQSYSTMSGPPGGFHDATILEVQGQTDNIQLRTAFVDYDYLKTFDIQLAAGRDFSREMSTDMGNVALLNESAALELGWTTEEAIGKIVRFPMFDSTERKVIGLVKDYNFASLHDEIEPLVIALGPMTWSMGIRLEASRLAEGIAYIEEAWAPLSPTFPISYTFVDESLSNLYENEQKESKVFSAFAMISIFLACLGIFGLVSHATLERSKEISIRKVLGAKTKDILGLISREFVLLIAAGALIATPLVAWFAQDWLEAFAYRIELGAQWPFFLIGGLAALVIDLGSMSWLVFRAAVRNPADNLRQE